MDSDTFLWRSYGKISLEIILAFYGENMVNQITKQSSHYCRRPLTLDGSKRLLF